MKKKTMNMFLDDGKTKEERKLDFEEKIKKIVDRGWILIGEVEFDKKNPFACGIDDVPYYMYTKYDNYKGNSQYHYSFCRGLNSVSFEDWFILDNRYSINTILTMFISADRDHGRLNGGHLMTKCDEFRVRLVGYKDWIEVDDDFLNSRITLAELEEKFRSNKEKLHIESMKKNPYMQNEEDQEMLKTYKIIT